MKTHKILKLFIIIQVLFNHPIYLNAQTYYPFLGNDKKWNILHTSNSWPEDSGYCYTEQIRLGNDTLIDGITYKVIISSKDSLLTRWNTIGFMRENIEDKNIFYLPVNKKEILLYDFSIEVNDTIETKFKFGEENTGVLDSIVKYVVISIDSIKINNQERKKINLKCLTYPWNITYSWIEGIGDIYGLFAPCFPFMCGSENTLLLCFYEDDNLVYSNLTGTYNECFYWLVSETYQNMPSFISIYPNPSDGKYIISVSITEPYNLTIMNNTGNIFLNKKIHGSYNIDISNLNNGLYYFIFDFKNFRVVKKTILKK